LDKNSNNPRIDIILFLKVQTNPKKIRYYDLGIRVQVFILIKMGIHWTQVQAFTYMSQSAQSRLRSKTIERDYNLIISKIIFLFYIVDTAKSGRFLLAANLTELIFFFVTQNLIYWNWFINRITNEIYKKINNNKTILTRSIYIILKNNNFNLIKLTIKPNLTDENKTNVAVKRGYVTWFADM